MMKVLVILGIDLTLLEQTLPAQPLPIRLIPLTLAVLLRDAQRITPDIEPPHKFCEFCRCSGTIVVPPPAPGDGCGGGLRAYPRGLLDVGDEIAIVIATVALGVVVLLLVMVVVMMQGHVLLRLVLGDYNEGHAQRVLDVALVLFRFCGGDAWMQ